MSLSNFFKLSTKQILTICFVVFIFFAQEKVYSQQKDTLYVQEYPHKWWVKFFIPNKFLSIQNGGDIFTPTYPQNIGLGLGLRKIIRNEFTSFLQYISFEDRYRIIFLYH